MSSAFFTSRKSPMVVAILRLYGFAVQNTRKISSRMMTSNLYRKALVEINEAIVLLKQQQAFSSLRRGGKCTEKLQKRHVLGEKNMGKWYSIRAPKFVLSKRNFAG